MNFKFRIQKLGHLCFLAVFILIISASLVFPKTANASSASLGIYPPLTQIEVSAPTLISAPIIIKNYSEETILLDINFRPFTASSYANGEVIFPENNISEKNSFLQRISILDGSEKIKEIILAPKQQKNLILQIDLKEEQNIQDQYFSVVFTSKKTEADNNLESNQTFVSIGISSNVILSASKKEKAKAFIEEFSTSLFIDRGPVFFKARVKNTGEQVINTKGAIYIKNVFNQTVGKVDLPNTTILAGTDRIISTGTDFPFIKWGEGFILGPYEASIRLSLWENGSVLVEKTKFFAFPAQLFIGLFITLVIVFLIVNRIRSHF